MTLPQKFRRLKLWIIAIPLLLILLGAASNQLVIIANHDKFPVLLNGVVGSGLEAGQMLPDDPVHCMMGPATHLNFLGDIFDMHDGWYSIGDAALFTGYWLWNYCPAVWLFAICGSVLGRTSPYEPLKQDSGNSFHLGSLLCGVGRQAAGYGAPTARIQDHQNM